MSTKIYHGYRLPKVTTIKELMAWEALDAIKIAAP
jgi:hypothetical protein